MSWEPVNLALLEERPATKPTVGGVGLVYPGKRHVFSGPQESAKTLCAYAIGLEDVRSGGTVVLIDFEMGQWDARDRLREMGATDDELASILYIEPETPADDETILSVLAWKPTLVIIDAAAGAFDLQALDDNRRADAEKFARTWIRTFWLHGVATIVIDHVVKNPDNRGKFAIGSERKTGGADVHVGFEVVAELTRGGRGLYKITTHKDRGGWLPRPRAGELELVSHPITHAISWTFRPPQERDESAEGFRPTNLMERVSRWLERQQEPVSRNAVEAAVMGKRDYLRLAIDCLVREEYVTETEGARHARLLLSVQAFREDDFAPTSPRLDTDDFAPTSPREKGLEQAEPTTSPHFAPTSPLAPESTSPQFALSLQGERTGRGEVVSNQKRPVIGDAMYPVLLAEAARNGHLTEDELTQRYALHKLVERSRADAVA